MALNWNKELKRYYSIKEVAEMIGSNESTLRYWEKCFPTIRPKTTTSGIRQYTKDDIDIIMQVNNLVRVRGYRIAAAKKLISANKTGEDRTTDVIESLIAAREELQELKKQLDYLD